MRRAQKRRSVHLHIDRLVVEDDAFAGSGPEGVHEAVHAVLAERLGGPETSDLDTDGLAGHVADAVGWAVQP